MGAVQSHMNWILRMIEEGNEDVLKKDASTLGKGATGDRRRSTIGGGANATKGR